MLRLRRSALFVLLVPAACAAPARVDDAPDSTEAAISSADTPCDGDWSQIGAGVSYKATGKGDAVFIGFAGYSVQSKWSCDWVDALQAARLDGLGVGHVIAVKGPRDASYSGGEIENSMLAKRLVADLAGAAPFILVAAHSSGSYVAHELLHELHGASSLDPDGLTRGKIVYANLDGGGTGFDASIAADLKKAAFVYATDPTLRSGSSANAGSIQAEAATYGTKAIGITSANSGCNSGAKWCLHDLLVTTKPHNPAAYDLAHDYTDFTNRPVQTAWIDALTPDLR